MLSSLLRPPAVLALALAVWGCGRPDPKAQAEAQKVDPQAEVAKPKPAAAEKQRPTWQREATPMPATFTGFPRPKLEQLDGVYVVDAKLHSRAAAWIIEDEGSKLTIVDRHGQERIHGITLSSPCALRLTDASGRASARAVVQLGDALIITSKGAVAVAKDDGSLLACVGYRTYQINGDGRCRYTTELLGVWSDPIEAKDACKLDTVGGERVLTIAGQALREHEGGVWLDELAAADVVEKAESREAAIAALEPKPAETGETGTGADETAD